MTYRILDLFCGAGGAATGYSRSGFEVVGVDISPQPHYPFEFHQLDAIEMLRRVVNGDWSSAFVGCDAIHASPPCQDHMRTPHPNKHGTGWMLAAARDLMEKTGLPYVIENVPSAPMRPDYRLCGCRFGLRIPGFGRLERERWFETSWPGACVKQPCDRDLPAVSVVGHGTPTWTRSKLGRNPTIVEYRTLMGIDWMNRNELSQAIPPAYTEYIGKYLIEYLDSTRNQAA